MNGEEGAGTRNRSGQYRAYQYPRRTEVVKVRLSRTEKDLIAAAAAREGLTPTGFAARAMLAAAQAGEPVTGLAGDLRELQRELFAARRAVNMFGSNVNQAAAAYNSIGELPEWVADAVRLCAAAVARLDEVTARVDRRLR